MLVQKLLSTTGKATGMGQFPFCIIAQPFAGMGVQRTVKISDGVYAQSPNWFVGSGSSGSLYYNAFLATYSSADGVRPESDIFYYNEGTDSANQCISTLSKVGTKRFTMLLDGNAEYLGAATSKTQGIAEFMYAEGFPADINSGNSTVGYGTGPQVYYNDSPTIATPPNGSSNWFMGYMGILDDTQYNNHMSANYADWSGVAFKVAFYKSNTTGRELGYIQREDNGSVTWKKYLMDGTHGDPYKGFRAMPCGTNGEDTLLYFGESKGGMCLINSSGTVLWKKDQNAALSSYSHTPVVDAAGAYAYTCNTVTLYKIDLSDGSVVSTSDIFPSGVTSASVGATSYTNPMGGFDSDGYLWVYAKNYKCLSRMDVSGANPVCVGAYVFNSKALGGILVDGDRIVGQALDISTTLNGSWFFCLATDLSTTTINQKDGEVYTRQYGIANYNSTSTFGTTDKFAYFSANTTSNTGAWSAYSTSSGSFTVGDYTGSWDFDTEVATYDSIMASRTTSGPNMLRSRSTVS